MASGEKRARAGAGAGAGQGPARHGPSAPRHSVGHTKVPFCLQSCVKPLTYAISISTLGTDYVHRFVGKEPSGLRYNTLSLNEEGEHPLGPDQTHSCPFLSQPSPKGLCCFALPFFLFGCSGSSLLCRLSPAWRWGCSSCGALSSGRWLPLRSTGPGAPRLHTRPGAPRLQQQQRTALVTL